MNPALSIRSILCAAALAAGALAVLAMPLTVTTAQAAEKHASPPKKSNLPATRYYTLSPFTLPLFDGEEVVEQMTIVIALEMVSNDRRAEIEHLVPKIRDVMYRELYNMVTFRRRGAPIPDVDLFKVRLLRAIRVVAGDKLVKTLLVQQAFKRPAR
jgi:hypothetical protein